MNTTFAMTCSSSFVLGSRSMTIHGSRPEGSGRMTSDRGKKKRKKKDMQPSLCSLIFKRGKRANKKRKDKKKDNEKEKQMKKNDNNKMKRKHHQRQPRIDSRNGLVTPQ
ncbi:uncharacterized protein BDW47DRAFT_111231 [Aspergillus candidus]|uniref:Uncharacterized protein n=1 Tax=Aspergillus candidus TaxID=41067 RepID=A0A2I2F331_ASPCN|nr:hypothetical protein BDW47DRAFT_111231 [Aspergillus candidus]PLB35006.1 hypothetical protein BDW47DRAFT_111231 [Aspergillus candidus]